MVIINLLFFLLLITVISLLLFLVYMIVDLIIDRYKDNCVDDYESDISVSDIVSLHASMLLPKTTTRSQVEFAGDGDAIARSPENSDDIHYYFCNGNRSCDEPEHCGKNEQGLKKLGEKLKLLNNK